MATVQAGFLCNAASTESSGLVSVLGAFVDTVTGPQLPVRHLMFVVVRLMLEPEDFDTAHAFGFEVVHSADGEVVARVDGGAPPQPRPTNVDPNLPSGVILSLPMSLEFRRVGIYTVNFRLDGDVAWSAPLKVQTSLPQL